MKNKNIQRIAVLGAGSWGTTIAIYLFKMGYEVRLWEYYPENVSLMNRTRRNPLLPGIPIPKELFITSDLNEVIDNPDLICLVVPSHAMRSLLSLLDDRIPAQALWVNLSKGVEQNSLKRMSELIAEVRKVPPDRIVTLHGPSHAEEVAREIPTAIVAASSSLKSAKRVQEAFMSAHLRIYTSTDIIGVELGGAIKNIIAIAAGICDGLGLGDNSKAALITRGLFEITRMGVRLGAREETFAGLSGVGDLIVTCFSKHSRNRYVGEEIGKGRKLQDILDGMTMIAEGVKTARTVHQMAEKYGIEMPISNEIYEVLFHDKNPRVAVKKLMQREPVKERHSLPENQ